MKNYYRLMLGEKSKYASECFNGNFVGADIGIQQDLTSYLTDNWRDFNKEFIPIWLNLHPGKSKVSAGLSCGALWTVAKGIQKGDVFLCPNGAGAYYVGEVTDNYAYRAGEILPYRRTVKWYDVKIERSYMSE